MAKMLSPDEPTHPGPHYGDRILNPKLLVPETPVRRYYFTNQGWQYTNYTVRGTPFQDGSHLRVKVGYGSEPDATTNLLLSDMGILPYSDGKFNPVAYTIIILKR